MNIFSLKVTSTGSFVRIVERTAEGAKKSFSRALGALRTSPFYNNQSCQPVFPLIERLHHENIAEKNDNSFIFFSSFIHPIATNPETSPTQRRIRPSI